MGSKSASDFAVMDFSSRQRFMDGQILLIDKPLEWTSFDVVNKLRWALRNRLSVALSWLWVHARNQRAARLITQGSSKVAQ